MKLIFAGILIILLLKVSAYASEVSAESCGSFDGAALDIVEARERFNNAIRDSDIGAVREALAEKVILITGSGSDVIVGRDAQIKIWNQYFADDTSLLYVRTPRCISLSGILPIAMERGSWRGALARDTVNHVSGEYSSKWRKVNGQWMIEAETYVTTNCGGSLCPEKTIE